MVTTDSNTFNGLTIEQLKPFPLPQKLSVLPQHILEEFSRLHELVTGYVKSLESYKSHREEVILELNLQIEKLNQCMELLEKYNQMALKIEGQMTELKKSFEEWTAMETIQYQLLASNFNLEALKRNFKKLMEEGESETEELVKEFKKTPQAEQDLGAFLNKFREQRKTYHLRKEKLNRWNEERVGGFI